MGAVCRASRARKGVESRQGKGLSRMNEPSLRLVSRLSPTSLDSDLPVLGRPRAKQTLTPSSALPVSPTEPPVCPSVRPPSVDF